MTARVRDRLAAVAGGCFVAALVWSITARGGTVPEAATGQAATPRLTVIAPTLAPVGPQPLPSAPVVTAASLEIPAIGVRTALESLALDRQGVLVPPHDFRKAGWFAAGTVPGDRGPAVIAGHIDSYDGPAVFLRLSSLRPGDLVTVRRSDGRAVRYRVIWQKSFAKNAFPSRLVYGPTPTPTLRLITCGGTYDHAAHRYPDDVVVFAEALA